MDCAVELFARKKELLLLSCFLLPCRLLFLCVLLRVFYWVLARRRSLGQTCPEKHRSLHHRIPRNVLSTHERSLASQSHCTDMPSAEEKPNFLFCVRTCPKEQSCREWQSDGFSLGKAFIHHTPCKPFSSLQTEENRNSFFFFFLGGGGGTS